MYIKVLYNIKKNKKKMCVWGGGGLGVEGQYLNPKHSQCIKKIFDRAEIRTHDLRVRKTCPLIHKAKHYHSNYKI